MNDQATEIVVEPTETVLETNEVKEASAPEQNAENPDKATGAVEEETKTQEVEKTFTQKELDEILQKRIHKAESAAERRALKAYAEKLEAMQKPVAQEPQAKSNNGKPTIAQYGEDVEGYVEAVAEWKLQQRDIETIKYHEAQQQAKIQTKAERLYAEAEKLPGFDVDTFESLLTPTIAHVVLDSDVAPKLMVYMAENPKDVERIASLSPARQAAEIGKLEAKLSEAKPVKASNAPSPIKPIGSRGSVASNNPEEMDADEYRAFRAKQGARWAR